MADNFRIQYAAGHLTRAKLNLASLSAHRFQLAIDTGFPDTEQTRRSGFIEPGDLQGAQDRLLLETSPIEFARRERLLLDRRSAGAGDGFRQMLRQERLIYRKRGR